MAAMTVAMPVPGRSRPPLLGVYSFVCTRHDREASRFHGSDFEPWCPRCVEEVTDGEQLVPVTEETAWSCVQRFLALGRAAPVSVRAHPVWPAPTDHHHGRVVCHLTAGQAQGLTHLVHRLRREAGRPEPEQSRPAGAPGEPQLTRDVVVRAAVRLLLEHADRLEGHSEGDLITSLVEQIRTVDDLSGPMRVQRVGMVWFRRHITDVINTVARNGARVGVTRHGRLVAGLVSAADLEVLARHVAPS